MFSPNIEFFQAKTIVRSKREKFERWIGHSKNTYFFKLVLENTQN